MFAHRKVISLAVAALFVTALAPIGAQQADKPGVHSGQILHYDIKIDDHDSDKFTRAGIILQIKTQLQPGQAPFRQAVSADAMRSSDGLFHINLTIPEYMATGDYDVKAYISISDSGINYTYQPNEISIPPVHINDDSQIHKPRITVTQRP